MRLPLALLTAAVVAGCSHATIRDTNIADTPDNRDVLEVLSRYKSAVEQRDVDGVLALVATTYFDAGDAARAKGARDYAQLKTQLPREFEKMRSLQLDVTVKDVTVDGDNAHVDYFYVLRYDLILPNGDKWYSSNDDARIRLVRLDGGWKIAAGL